MVETSSWPVPSRGNSSRTILCRALACLVWVGLSEVAWAAKGIVPVGDIEGMSVHWKTLEEAQLIRIDPGNSPTLLSPDSELLFLGDCMRRGPCGRATVERVHRLHRRYPHAVMAVLGNHDLNVLSLLAILPALKLGIVDEYAAWLAQRGRPDGPASRVRWWAETYAVWDKVLNWWIELAAQKLGVPADDPAFLGRIRDEKGKVAEASLAAIIGEDEIAGRFIEFVSPGGEYWEFLEETPMLRVKTHSGGKWVVLHSGQLTSGNLGVVPGVASRFTDRSDPDWLEQWARSLDQEFKRSDLHKMKKLLSRFDALDPARADQRVQATELALALRKIHLPLYGDTGWDPVLKRVECVADSVVYPDRQISAASSIPGLPGQDVIDRLAGAGVQMVLGGHIPVGDGVLVRVGHSERHRRTVRFVLADTSYSPIEGRQLVRIEKDGSILAKVTARDGTRIVVDLPEDGRIQQLLAAPAGSPERSRGEQTNRIGRILDGYIIVGFVARDGAAWEPDYEKVALMRQDGYSFVYKTVDRSGLEAAIERFRQQTGTSELPYAVTDFSKAYAEAHAAQETMLAKHGKTVLAENELAARLRGKMVYLSSGPAASSFSKVLQHETGRKNCEAYLKGWARFLRDIPREERWVFVGGGTTGLEQEKNRLVVEVGRERAAEGAAPFELVGAITGLTGGSELDPAVTDFTVTRAYYWGDYFEEVLALLEQATQEPATQIVIEFAGGGSIVTRQIDQALAFQGRHPGVTVQLTAGLSPERSPSATDRFIHALGDGRAVRPGLRVVDLESLERRSRAD